MGLFDTRQTGYRTNNIYRAKASEAGITERNSPRILGLSGGMFENSQRVGQDAASRGLGAFRSRGYRVKLPKAAKSERATLLEPREPVDPGLQDNNREVYIQQPAMMPEYPQLLPPSTPKPEVKEKIEPDEELMLIAKKHGYDADLIFKDGDYTKKGRQLKDSLLNWRKEESFKKVAPELLDDIQRLRNEANLAAAMRTNPPKAGTASAPNRAFIETQLEKHGYDLNRLYEDGKLTSEGARMLGTIEQQIKDGADPEKLYRQSVVDEYDRQGRGLAGLLAAKREEFKMDGSVKDDLHPETKSIAEQMAANSEKRQQAVARQNLAGILQNGSRTFNDAERMAIEEAIRDPKYRDRVLSSIKENPEGDFVKSYNEMKFADGVEKSRGEMEQKAKKITDQQGLVNQMINATKANPLQGAIYDVREKKLMGGLFAEKERLEKNVAPLNSILNQQPTNPYDVSKNGLLAEMGQSPLQTTPIVALPKPKEVKSKVESFSEKVMDFNQKKTSEIDTINKQLADLDAQMSEDRNNRYKNSGPLSPEQSLAYSQQLMQRQELEKKRKELQAIQDAAEYGSAFRQATRRL